MTYRAGRSPHWIKIKNRKHPALSRDIDRPGNIVPEEPIPAANRTDRNVLRSSPVKMVIPAQVDQFTHPERAAIFLNASCGKAQEARDLMKDCTAHDLREAITILEDQALWAGKLSEIGERHHASDDESIRDVLIRAAAAGDEEAKALIACDLLELKMY